MPPLFRSCTRRSPRCSAALAVAAAAVGRDARTTFGAFGISLGTLAAFLILLHARLPADHRARRRVADGPGAPGRRRAHLRDAGPGARETQARDNERRRRKRPPSDSSGRRRVRIRRRASRCCIARRSQIQRERARGAGGTHRRRRRPARCISWPGSTRRGRERCAIAGRDPASLDESERRTLLGVVPQVVQLFSGTVCENLTLTDASVPEAAVLEAAQDRRCRRVHPRAAAGLPGPCSAAVAAATGAQLSAGQQQLLAPGPRARAQAGGALASTRRPPRSTAPATPRFARRCASRCLPAGCAVLTVAHRPVDRRGSRPGDRARKGLDRRGRRLPASSPAAPGRFAALLELEAAGWDWRSGP